MGFFVNLPLLTVSGTWSSSITGGILSLSCHFRRALLVSLAPLLPLVLSLALRAQDVEAQTWSLSERLVRYFGKIEAGYCVKCLNRMASELKYVDSRYEASVQPSWSHLGANWGQL